MKSVFTSTIKRIKMEVEIHYTKQVRKVLDAINNTDRVEDTFVKNIVSIPASTTITNQDLFHCTIIVLVDTYDLTTETEVDKFVSGIIDTVESTYDAKFFDPNNIKSQLL